MDQNAGAARIEEEVMRSHKAVSYMQYPACDCSSTMVVYGHRSPVFSFNLSFRTTRLICSSLVNPEAIHVGLSSRSEAIWQLFATRQPLKIQGDSRTIGKVSTASHPDRSVQRHLQHGRILSRDQHSYSDIEELPALPPKDKPAPFVMGVNDQLLVSPSTSKRKREMHNNPLDPMQHGIESEDSLDEHTPKRSRNSNHASDVEASEENTPARQRGLLRRKQKIGNLSHLNLRHKAQQQQQSTQGKAGSDVRDSKFQEGSLTDKPSVKPPSIFTRMVRTDSGNLAQVDDLMADYHDGLTMPSESADEAVEREKAMMDQRVDAISAESSKRDDNGGFLRFGRQFVSGFSFHPVNLWNKVWNDTKDELINKNLEEAERLARQKAEAEARYAEMKKTGQFKMQPVGMMESTLPQSHNVSSPRDSGIVLDPFHGAEEQQRDLSTSTINVHPVQSTENAHSSASGSEAPDSAAKMSRGFMSRLHFKRPSFSNLKRVRSDINLSATSNRDFSTSISPIKSELDSALRRSVSKIDLKKQHKLSKRVSDLELRLQQARQELDDALVDASPVPQLNSKYQRFVPSGTVRRPKFMPGKLPTLSSQQIFDPAQLSFGEDMDQERVKPRSEVQDRQALDLTTAFEDDGEETIKAPREKSYPVRASTLFDLDNLDTVNRVEPDIMRPSGHTSNQKNQPDQASAMECADSSQATAEVGGAEPNNSANYSSLDAKLKALDAQVKTMTKSKNRKRKSGDKDGMFKPTGDHDDDADEVGDDAGDKRLVKRKKSKKRKVTNKNDSSPSTKRLKSVNDDQNSPKSQKPVKLVADKTSLTPLVGGMSLKKQITVEVESESDDEIGSIGVATDAGGLLDVPPGRLSLDSQAVSLEPVYEEEEELVDDFDNSATTVLHGNSSLMSAAVPIHTRRVLDPSGARTGTPKKSRPTTMHADNIARNRGKENSTTNDRKEEFAWPEDVF
nr:hypothetical protein CFP56_13039 [Quercus suber]